MMFFTLQDYIFLKTIFFSTVCDISNGHLYLVVSQNSTNTQTGDYCPEMKILKKLYASYTKYIRIQTKNVNLVPILLLDFTKMDISSK